MAIATFVFAIGAAPASAAYVHTLPAEGFGGDGTSGTTFETQTPDRGSLAVDQVHHRLYAVRGIPKKGNNDASAPRLYGFDISNPGSRTLLSGFPVGAPAGIKPAVDNSVGSSGNIYYSTDGMIGSFTSSGVPRESFPAGATSIFSGLAVDSAGHLWVSNSSTASVDEHAASGALLDSVSVITQGSPGPLAIDLSTGDLYVGRGNFQSAVWKYTAADGYASGTPFAPGEVRNLSFDTAHHVLYVQRGERIDAYNADGTLIETLAASLAGANASLQSMAVDESTGTVYALSYLADRIVALPGAVVPDETTGDQTAKASVTGHVDPAGGPALNDCRFEYLPEAAFHEVQNEIQTVTVSGASAGGFALVSPTDESESSGKGTLTAGSSSVTSLVTGVGTATLQAGSTFVGGLSTSFGRFPEGAEVTGPGIQPGTTISQTGFPDQRTLSAPATASGASVTITAVGPMPFANGQMVAGPGIPLGTTIAAVAPGSVTLSQPATASTSGATLYAGAQSSMTGAGGSGTLSAGSNIISNLLAAAGTAELNAGSTFVSGISTSTGSFAVGQPISGAGIPPGTTITFVLDGAFILSNAATVSGSGVVISSEGPTPFAVGEAISGAGIPPGTIIAGVGPGTITLSQPATASAAAVPLSAGLGFGASAAAVQNALEALSSIGTGNVEVSGPGGGPYTVKFKGALSGDVPQLGVGFDLTPPGASVGVVTTKNGGQGWSITPATAPCSPGAPIAEGTDVAATLPGLIPENPYRYRLNAGNANGSSIGLERTIIPHWVDLIKTEEANPIGRFTATLNGSFNGTGEDTHYRFEWKSTSSEDESPEANTGITTGPTPLSFEATGLTPDTVYSYRVTGSNTNGTSHSEYRTFKTLPAVLGISTGPATEVAPHGAKLNASFTGTNQDTHYYFEWGPTKFYGKNTAEEDAGLGTNGASTPISTDLGGLELEKIYHYRVVAKNSSGTSFGKDEIFITPPAVAGVSTEAASAISLASATLNGSFVGNGSNTSFYFDWGPTPAYGNRTAVPPGVSAGAPNGPTAVSAQVSEFKGFTTYHYRLVATNGEGSTFGADHTFTTPAALVPVVGTSGSSAIGPTSAIVEAQVNPNRWDTVYLFEYGPSASYGSSTPIEGPIGSDIANHPVSAQLSALAPGTTYHFRAVAINFVGTAYGPDRTFTTLDAPRIDSSAASGVGSNTAHLSALATANGVPTSVSFEYGTDGSYGQRTPQTPIGDGFAQHEAGVDLGGLAPSTTYHFRAVAASGLGTRTGPDRTFTTQGLPPTKEGTPKKCKPGFVKRRGKCVKRKKHGNAHHHSHRHD